MRLPSDKEGLQFRDDEKPGEEETKWQKKKQQKINERKKDRPKAKDPEEKKIHTI